MVNFCLYFFLTVLQIFCYNAFQDAVAYNSELHCRDNDNNHVDWWIIYKPASDTGQFFESGLNFTYIASYTEGRWVQSEKPINPRSMLQYTLTPVYKKKYKQYLAVMSYGVSRYASNYSAKSTAYGIMFTNNLNGVWISHTVPGFPNLAKKPALFPENELNSGHMIICQSVHPETMNSIAVLVRHTRASILKFTVPESMIVALPEWTLLESNTESDEKLEQEEELFVHKAVQKTHNNTEKGIYRPYYVRGLKTKTFHYETKEKSMNAMVLGRSPGDSRCLFNTFAKIQGIVVDVYNNALHKRYAVCEEEYSSRIINSISLKYPEQEVHYINNGTDKINFGVSTAAHWQRHGQGGDQYWTCIGNFAGDSSSPPKGGYILCLNHYYVWLAFDNFKVKEPEC